MTPSIGGAHWLMVDEDPNDGDATYLQQATFDVPVMKVGVRIAGVPYYGEAVALSGGYVVHDDTFLTNPATGAPMTKQAVAAMQPIVDVDGSLVEAFGWDVSAIGDYDLITSLVLRRAARSRSFAGSLFARLSQLIGVATVVTHPARPTASAAAVVPGVTGGASGPGASAAPRSPSARASASAPAASGFAVSRSASATPTSPSSSAVAVQRSAFGADSRPTATAQAIGPTASGDSVSPDAAAAVFPGPSAEGV